MGVRARCRWGLEAQRALLLAFEEESGFLPFSVKLESNGTFLPFPRSRGRGGWGEDACASLATNLLRRV